MSASLSQASKKRRSSPKKRRGWGPFQSVLKERSVDFNLTLDVQNLKQQVQDLTTLRDVLSTRSALRRHSPEGSLFHVVQEYFHVFRTGWAVQESGRKRLLEDRDQRAFLHSVMDPEVDVDNGLRGPDVMAEQIIMYSTFITFIRLTMKSYEIVVAEDSVVIQTRSRLRFQVTRSTIEMIFPHVIGDECLVAQLVGCELEPIIGVTFFFNEAGKCCKYKVDLDFVEAFSTIVTDPHKLDMLLGKALIADNCMFGLLDEPPVPKQAKPQTLQHALEDERDRLVDELKELHEVEVSSEGSLEPPSPSRPLYAHAEAQLLQVVSDYFMAFASAAAQSHQLNFIHLAFVSETSYTPDASGKYVYQRWRALSECFDVLGFHQGRILSIEYNHQEDACTVRAAATYTLRITPYTIERVFPHVKPYSALVSALVGRVLQVPSELSFSIETDTGRIFHLTERMDFVHAITTLLPSRQDASFVLSHARLALDGVSCGHPQSVSTVLPLPQLSPAWPNHGKHRMNMADILNS